MPATNIETRATETLTRTLFAVDGVRHELVTHRTGKGRVEVYVEYADAPGLMQWRGYFDEVVHADPKLAARVHPVLSQHQAVHADFWRAYLPGASTWPHAA